MPYVIKRGDGKFVGLISEGMPYVDSITRAYEYSSRTEALANCCAGEQVIEVVSRVVEKLAPAPRRSVTVSRPRETISAVEVLQRLSNKKADDPYGPERIFALGLIEAAISEITNGR